jgi:hypothetical protein
VVVRFMVGSRVVALVLAAGLLGYCLNVHPQEQGGAFSKPMLHSQFRYAGSDDRKLERTARLSTDGGMARISAGLRVGSTLGVRSVC